MMKGLFIRLKEYCKAFIGRFKQGTNTSVFKRKFRTIERVDQLKEELQAITEGYEKALTDLNKDYRKKAFQYDKKYLEYKDINKLLTPEEVAEANEKLQPYEYEVREAGAEIDKVEGYKKDDVMNIINQLQKLEKSYTEELSSQIEADAERLKEARKTYMDIVASIGESYRDVLETDKLMEHHLSDAGFKYDGTMTERVAVGTEKLSVNLDDMMIDKEAVVEAMKGQKEYKV